MSRYSVHNKFVLPGDPLGMAEEFLSGPGTFESNDHICSAGVGLFTPDSKEMTAIVSPATPLPTLGVGDLVVGVVGNIGSAKVIVDIHFIEGRGDRAVFYRHPAILHVSKISKTYVRDAGAAYRLRDIVRAKVLQAAPSLELCTSESSLGAIKSFCMRCSAPLTLKGDKLVCPNCERVEHRKIAEAYGQYKLVA